jgi:hypothetical protein
VLPAVSKPGHGNPARTQRNTSPTGRVRHPVQRLTHCLSGSSLNNAGSVRHSSPSKPDSEPGGNLKTPIEPPKSAVPMYTSSQRLHVQGKSYTLPILRKPPVAGSFARSRPLRTRIGGRNGTQSVPVKAFAKIFEFIWERSNRCSGFLGGQESNKAAGARETVLARGRAAWSRVVEPVERGRVSPGVHVHDVP